MRYQMQQIGTINNGTRYTLNIIAEKEQTSCVQTLFCKGYLGYLDY